MLLTETDVLVQLNLSHDALVAIVFEGELKAYAPGAGSTALVIPKQSSKETETCPAARKLSCHKKSLIDLSKYGKPDTEDGCYKALCDYYNFEKPKAIDLSKYSNHKASAPPMPQSASNPDDNIGCLSAFQGLLYPPHREYEYSIFYDSNGAVIYDRLSGLLAITINENVHHSVRQLALSCLLPDLRFRPSHVDALSQSLFPEVTAPQITRDHQSDTAPATPQLTAKQKAARANKQIPREKVRAKAKELWLKYPNMTKVDMAMRDEICTITGATDVTPKTIENWIANLNPDRSRGRRPKKT